jgi:rod shape-determining protein MreD
MTELSKKPILVILVSFIAALLLSIVTLPSSLQWFRPEWMVMLVIYWLLVLPNSLGVSFAWFFGIFLDILYDTPFGEHALALVIISYFIVRFYAQIRLFNALQQFILILSLMIFYQTILFWVHSLFGHPHGTFYYWIPSFTSALVWPIVLYVLKSYSSYER